jgi:hypothetical protein
MATSDRQARTKGVVILAIVAVATFVGSTVAVSAMSSRRTASANITYPFAKSAIGGRVNAPIPGTNTFALTFTTKFTLAQASHGLIDPANNQFGNVTVASNLAYPIPNPGGATVGPVALPFSSETLALNVAIQGSCFRFNGTAYAFSGTPSACATAALTLGQTSYDVSPLLTVVAGQFTPRNAAKTKWAGSLTAQFTNPGYTFPIAALGSQAAITLTIGNDGTIAPTKSVSFNG